MIDLGKTLRAHKLTQVDFAKDLTQATGENITKARVWWWVHEAVPKAWDIFIRQYFVTRGLKVFGKVVKKP